MSDVNSAESYYQYRIESDAKIAKLTSISERLNTELRDMKLQSAIEKQVRDPDVSNLIFALTKSSAMEKDNGFRIGDVSLDRAISDIKSNESLQRFFSKADTLRESPDTVSSLPSLASLRDCEPIDIELDRVSRDIPGVFHSVAANLVWTTSESATEGGQVHRFVNRSSVCHVVRVSL